MRAWHLKPIRGRVLALGVTVALGLAAGCGDQVSSPVPQPVPGMIRQSTPSPSGVQLLFVGLPGAVAGAGRVHLTYRKSGKGVVVDSAAGGSFAAALTRVALDELEARFENDDGLSDPVPLSTQLRFPTGPVFGQPKPGVVSKPDAQGQVRVSNDAGAAQPLLLDATPNMDLLVANDKTGALATTKTDKDGRFTTQLAAASGQSIRLLLVDPTDVGVTSDFVTIPVP